MKKLTKNMNRMLNGTLCSLVNALFVVNHYIVNDGDSEKLQF